MEEHRLPIVAAIEIYVQRKSHRAIWLQMWKRPQRQRSFYISIASQSPLHGHSESVFLIPNGAPQHNWCINYGRARETNAKNITCWMLAACDASDESSVKQIGEKITEANCALLFLASSKKENWMSRWNVQCQRWRRDELAGSRVMQPPPLPFIFHSATDGFFELFLLLFRWFFSSSFHPWLYTIFGARSFLTYTTAVLRAHRRTSERWKERIKRNHRRMVVRREKFMEDDLTLNALKQTFVVWAYQKPLDWEWKRLEV